jgi:hypothetical protein
MSADALFDVPPAEGVIRRGAELSPDGLYRYTLTREWDYRCQTVVFVGLNPSIADAEQDDPTIRRCIRFARDWGFGSLLMVNLFAWRATDPSTLAAAPDMVGPANDAILQDLHRRAGLAVAAWGSHPVAVARAGEVIPWLGDYRVLGETKDGHPRHPLYMKASCTPIRPTRRQGPVAS